LATTASAPPMHSRLSPRQMPSSELDIPLGLNSAYTTMKPSASRYKYACRIIAGRLMNWQADSLEKVKHVEEGRQNEPLAVAQLEELYQIDTRPVGIVTTDDGRFGASPDRVANVAPDERSVGIVVECKCPTIPVQMERLLLGDGDAYRCQRQGHLFVAEADKALFVSYNPRMPLYQVESGRDETFIQKLKAALEQFSDELEEMTEKARRLGMFQAFEEMRTPAEAELAPETQLEPAPEDVARWLE